MQKFFYLVVLLFLSCSTIHRAIYKAEEEHHALYKQKALVVYEVSYNKVHFTNPPCTRCYFLKGKHYVAKWQEGDTLIIDDNLADFYDLHFNRCP